MPSDTSALSARNIVKLAGLLPTHLRGPRVGIVCGSGLGTLAESITERVIVPYSALEGFGQSTGKSSWRYKPLVGNRSMRARICVLKVPGHRSELAFGKIGDVPVVAMLGRVCPFVPYHHCGRY